MGIERFHPLIAHSNQQKKKRQKIKMLTRQHYRPDHEHHPYFNVNHTLAIRLNEM